MRFSFDATVIEWRGPAPFYFAPTDERVSAEIASMAGQLTYGWGCIPVNVTIGGTTFYTALIPREGSYFVPLKVAVRKAEGIELGERVAVELNLRA